MNDYLKSYKCKKISAICTCLCLFAMLFLHLPVKASETKSEVYNQGINTGITSFLKYYLSVTDEPILYIDVKDACKLGLKVEDIENGITLSNSTKKVDIYFNSSAKIDDYMFEEPLLKMGEQTWIMLDVIGKCFSNEYSVENADGFQRIYLDTGELTVKYEPGSIVINSCIFNFQNNIYSIQLQNQTYRDFENVKIFTAYYAKDGRLMDIDINNVYNIEGKDKITTFVPLNDCYYSADEIKIMLWDGKNVPLVEMLMPKSFQLQLKDMPPENPEDREQIFPDATVNNKYYDAIYVVHNNFQDIGLPFIYEDGTFKPENNIMRNEFAYKLNKIIGNDFKNVDVDCNIADVMQTDWCNDEIGYLISKEIMMLKDGYFYPLENITLYESLYAFLRVLGEEDFTTSMITELAMKYNLLDNIEVQDSVITKEVYAQLLCNFTKEYMKLGI